MLKLLGLVVGSYFIFVIMCKRINSKLVSEGLKGIPDGDCWKPQKMLSVILGYTLNLLIPQHVFEQYVLRFYDDDCAKCLKQGRCTSCGCNTKAKMWSPLEKDSRDNWQPIIWSRKKYKEFREKFPVEIKTIYKNLNKEE